MDWSKVKKMNIRDVVQNKEWQDIRKNLLYQWKKNETKCVEELKKYLLKYSNTEVFPFAVRRVYNYITGSYFRIHYKNMGFYFKKFLEQVRYIYKYEKSSFYDDNNNNEKKEEKK